jgi:hypothetical protein
MLAFTCSTFAHTSAEDQWSEAPTVRSDLKLGAISEAAKEDSEEEEPEEEHESVEEKEEEPEEPEDEDTEDEKPPPPSPPAPAPAPAPPPPPRSHPASGRKDPSCNAQGWCQSPEAPYSQQCTDDAGSAWQDDGEIYPNKHYWSGSPAKPQLPSNGKCPPPLAASCARKGAKAAYLDGPINCGGKGFFCRIMPQADWVNSDAKPMAHEKASFHLKVFKEANFYHCNTTSMTEPTNNQMQTEVRENQKEETRGRKAFLRVDDKKELKDPPRI